MVLSDFVTEWPDLADVPGRARRDGVAIGEGHGRDIRLAIPFNSVSMGLRCTQRHRLNRRRGRDDRGAVMKTVFPEAEGSYRFELEGIGSVEVQVR